MIITEADLKLNLDRYLDMAASGDITITRDGHEVGRDADARTSKLVARQTRR